MTQPPIICDSADPLVPAVTGQNSNGDGVRGIGTQNGVAGVGVGSGPSSNGVNGFSSFGTGVWGGSDSGFGVIGISSTREGVLGETNAADFVAAVMGLARNDNGVAVGVLGQSNGGGAGVIGRSNNDAGVIGFHGDPRLQETTVENEAGLAGVFGASDSGSGVVGYSRSPDQPAIYAFGGLRATAANHPYAGLFDGNVTVNGNIFTPGADCAEQFDIVGLEELEPGSVVVIDQGGALRPSESAYDRRVAGVISGAGTYRPGFVLDSQESVKGRQPVALVGKVFCKADARETPIEVGDLLTTSHTPGHAMKAEDPTRAFGAILGKSLDRLTSGTGLVRILVSLQ